MPPLQRYLQDLLHGYGHDEKEQQVSIIVDRALSSQRRSRTIKSAHENMRSMFQEINQSGSISDKSIIHTQADTAAARHCQCFNFASEYGSPPTTSRPRSSPIPINCKCQDSSNDNDSTEQMMVQYDLSTWRMYNRIVHHRRRRSSTVPPCTCPKKGTKVCRENYLSNVPNSHWSTSSNRSNIPHLLGSKNRRDYFMPVVAKGIISEEDTYDHEMTTIFELDEDF